MTSVITSPENIINLALVRVGREPYVQSIYEGSLAAKAALAIYGQTRDDLLRTQDWPFARRDVGLTLLKAAPPGGYVPPTVWDATTNPPLPYSYEYAYPADALRIRSVRNADTFLVNYDPRDNLFTVSNDNNYSPAQKVILCDVGPTAVASYTGQILDPSTMDADFIEVLVAALATPLAISFEKFEAARIAGQNELREEAEAENVQGG